MCYPCPWTILLPFSPDRTASLANNVIQLADSRYRRLRIGSYRVLFSVETTTITVLVVLRVRHRSEAYD